MHRSRLRLAIYATAAIVAAGGGVGGAFAATTPAAGDLTVVAATRAVPAPARGDAPMRVAPYVDMGLLSNGSAGLAEMASGANIRSYSLGFVTAAGCRATWFNAFDPRDGAFADQISAVRANGGDVRVSFGGASGTELAQACTDVAALRAEYQAVVSAYGLRHIDLDIEGEAVADRDATARRSAALAALQRDDPGLKISLTLPVLPEGLTADGVDVLRSARDAGVELELVNIMAMDYGRPGEDYGDLAIRAAEATKDQIRAIYGVDDAAAYAMVGVTPMAGVNDDGGLFTTADARDLVTFANANDLGFVSFWEAGRDRNACVGALFQCTNVPQTPYAFSRVFDDFTG